MERGGEGRGRREVRRRMYGENGEEDRGGRREEEGGGEERRRREEGGGKWEVGGRTPSHRQLTSRNTIPILRPIFDMMNYRKKFQKFSELGHGFPRGVFPGIRKSPNFFFSHKSHPGIAENFFPIFLAVHVFVPENFFSIFLMMLPLVS
jgi:hypothetical protein